MAAPKWPILYRIVALPQEANQLQPLGVCGQIPTQAQQGSAGAHLHRTAAALGQAKETAAPKETAAKKLTAEKGTGTAGAGKQIDAGSGQESRSAEACKGRFQENGNTIADNA